MNKLKAGQIILNSKKHPCLILKVDDNYYWLFSKTPKGFNCNHYYKRYIEDSIIKGNYNIIEEYPTWQEAIINSKEFNDV